MITPYEIEHKKFSKAVRGYKDNEVDEFLDEIIIDLEKLLEENKQQHKMIESLKAELGNAKVSENSVINTLESAKNLMNDISASAEKRAQIILKNAQMDAEVIQREAKDSVAKYTEEGDTLKRKVVKFRDRYRQLLEDELGKIEGSSEELILDLEKEFVPASMDEPKLKPYTSAEKATEKEDLSVTERIMEEFQSEGTTTQTIVKNDLSKTRII